MATIRKRNGKYQVQVRINGYISSKTFPCYELAKKWASKQEIIAFTEPEKKEQKTSKDTSINLSKVANTQSWTKLID